MRHTWRETPILRQAGVIDHPPLRTDLPAHPQRQPPPDRLIAPRRIGDELLQPLLIPVRQPGRHRLDRLTPPLQQQPANILLALRALITTRQRPVLSSANSINAARCASRSAALTRTRQLATSPRPTSSLHPQELLHTANEVLLVGPTETFHRLWRPRMTTGRRPRHFPADVPVRPTRRAGGGRLTGQEADGGGTDPASTHAASAAGSCGQDAAGVHRSWRSSARAVSSPPRIVATPQASAA